MIEFSNHEPWLGWYNIIYMRINYFVSSPIKFIHIIYFTFWNFRFFILYYAYDPKSSNMKNKTQIMNITFRKLHVTTKNNKIQLLLYVYLLHYHIDCINLVNTPIKYTHILSLYHIICETINNNRFSQNQYMQSQNTQSQSHILIIIYNKHISIIQTRDNSCHTSPRINLKLSAPPVLEYL